LEARLQTVQGLKCERLVTREANTWGYLTLEAEGSVVIPIGYSDVGMTPRIWTKEEAAIVGINEAVVGYNLFTGLVRFKYEMPTVFHEFIRDNDNGVIVRDETGFVGLSHEGREDWKFCEEDIINRYDVSASLITGETLEGYKFRFEIPVAYRSK